MASAMTTGSVVPRSQTTPARSRDATSSALGMVVNLRFRVVESVVGLEESAPDGDALLAVPAKLGTMEQAVLAACPSGNEGGEDSVIGKADGGRDESAIAEVRAVVPRHPQDGGAVATGPTLDRCRSNLGAAPQNSGEGLGSQGLPVTEREAFGHADLRSGLADLGQPKAVPNRGALPGHDFLDLGPDLRSVGLLALGQSQATVVLDDQQILLLVPHGAQLSVQEPSEAIGCLDLLPRQCLGGSGGLGHS